MSTVEVSPYNPSWSKMAGEEMQAITSHLGGTCMDIHHIGSTAVPGLAAKQDLDFILVVDALNNALPLQEIGYTFKGEYNIPLRYYFSKNTHQSKVNLHVCEPGHGFIDLNLTFRDWLRHHEADRKAYQALKYRILESPDAGVKTREGFTKYNRSKNDFIKGILKKADYTGTLVNCCLHDAEWEAAKGLRNTYFFKPNNIEDPYTWTFDHKDHKHLVLYHGMEVVGYAHVQLWPQHRAAIRIIVVDEHHRGKGYGRTLMKVIERHLSLQGYTSLHTESTPAALGFYEDLGFTPMAFDDPDGYEGGPEDIALGKDLLA